MANGLKFVAINNIPLEKNRRSRFNVVKQAARTPQAVSSRTWAVACRNFPLTSWRGAVAARRPRRTSSCFANATPERPALHFTILGASPRYQRDGISGAQLPAPFRRIGIIINRKSPRLEGTSAWVRRGAADSGTLRAQRWRPRERLTSIGREKLFGRNSAQART